MKRIEFLKKKWSNEKMIFATRNDHSVADAAKIFDVLLDADPTPKKLYAEFVFRCYANREFLVEDVERIRDTLTVFHSNKRRLPVERRDIGGYGSERDVWQVLTEAGLIDASELSGKASKRSDRNRAYLDSDVFTADGWTMAKLGSAFAAQWWGLGTRWCTTEKSGNMYHSYAKQGPLRVFVSPEGVKHQLHIGTVSLCDATDRRVNMSAFFKTLPPSFIPLIREDVGVFSPEVARFDDPHREFRYFHQKILQLPSEFFSTEVEELVARLRKAGMESLHMQSERDGWTMEVPKSDLSSWALRLDAGEVYDFNDRHKPLALIRTPSGERLLVDYEEASMAHALRLVPDMPPQFREMFLQKGVKGPFDIEKVRPLHAAIFSAPAGELSSQFWKSWAKKVAGYDTACLKRREPLGPWGVLPEEVMNEDIALIFAKEGLRARIPARLVTRPVALSLAKADESSRNDPATTALLTDDDVADVYGGNNGKNLAGLPARYRTLDMTKRIVRKRRGALKALVRMVRDGDFDLAGEPIDRVVEQLVQGALEQSAASLIDIDIPLPRQTYLDIVRRDAGMMSWVPLEYRDVELCSASIDHSTHGLCHFPVWVVEAIREANAGGHGITHNYRPSVKYAQTLKGLAKPEGEVAAALKPFSVQAQVAELGRRP
ncbi:hypothetical protein [Rhizobium sp. BK176]|uniref:hypothetical protein n=1 Tax=Rhizobium sp. BK176 TaxID=2587071 RepID=UPI00216A10D4|nr:hypothetical protein [Rhizobium sp. BK176]MCS4090104.1 hypothetical protein [Rhizobium sp. BK176]